MEEIEKTISTAAEYVSRLRHRVGTQIWNLSWRGFILNSWHIHVNCQEPASLITTIDELERSSSYCEEVSLSLPLPSSSCLSFFSLLFPVIFNHRRCRRRWFLVKSREYVLSVEQKWHRRSKVSRARRFTPSRITYHGNVSRLNKSAVASTIYPPFCVCRFFLSRRHFFFLPHRPVRLLVLLADRCHACIPIPIASSFSQTEQSEHDEEDIPRVRWSKGQLMVRRQRKM